MKQALANADAGMAGLIIFIVFFAIVLAWVFRPGSNEKFKKFAEIPLKDE